MADQTPSPAPLRSQIPTIDLRDPALLATLASELDHVAAELRSLWSSALEAGDFIDVTRFAEAGHAVQRAVIALETDQLIADNAGRRTPQEAAHGRR
jgi:hypothetical protein